MKRRNISGLILLNCSLLGVLAVVTLGSDVDAQQAIRPRGQYLAVGGTMNGTTMGVLYVLDETNRELMALQWNEQLSQLKGLGYRNLAADMAAGGGGSTR
ncbi:MAG: hypothetical protein EXS00_07405 [Phycisphaerales bacterium]|nr:hypothetical protein [Phycisphaerales bacterium]